MTSLDGLTIRPNKFLTLPIEIERMRGIADVPEPRCTFNKLVRLPVTSRSLRHSTTLSLFPSLPAASASVSLDLVFMQNRNTKAVTPFLRWAGGKRALLDQIWSLAPASFSTYFEPFLGSGAMLFSLKPGTPALVGDANRDLITTYLVVRDRCDELITRLTEFSITKEHYLVVRGQDRLESTSLVDPLEVAARFIFLNHCAFNGIYRVNAQGQFNVPWGAPRASLDRKFALIREASAFLNTPSNKDPSQLAVQFAVGHFADLLSSASEGDFVYMDPPYDLEVGHNTFVSYQSGGFGIDLQEEVCSVSTALRDGKKVNVVLSNAATERIVRLYNSAGFNVREVEVRRSIGASAATRKKILEILIS